MNTYPYDDDNNNNNVDDNNNDDDLKMLTVQETVEE